MSEFNATFNQIKKNIQSEINPEIINTLQTNDTLCPELWDDNLKLNTKIKNNLLKIAKDFFQNLELPENIKIIDIIIVGSIVNYNWSKYSDIDLHIILDTKKIHTNKNISKNYIDAEKNLFNNKHNITIKKFPVEIYIQDINEKLNSDAKFSILKNTWINKPEKNNININTNLIEKKLNKLFAELEDIKKLYDQKNYKETITQATKLSDKIKKMRKIGLEKNGEASIENLTFKCLRRTDFIELINNYKNQAYDKSMTIMEMFL